MMILRQPRVLSDGLRGVRGRNVKGRGGERYMKGKVGPFWSFEPKPSSSIPYMIASEIRLPRSPSRPRCSRRCLRSSTGTETGSWGSGSGMTSSHRRCDVPFGAMWSARFWPANPPLSFWSGIDSRLYQTGGQNDRIRVIDVGQGGSIIRAPCPFRFSSQHLNLIHSEILLLIQSHMGAASPLYCLLYC